MDWKLELVAVPVSDVDRAKTLYTEQVGFNADHDHTVSDEIRFVQLTPPDRPVRSPSARGWSTALPAALLASDDPSMCLRLLWSSTAG